MVLRCYEYSTASTLSPKGEYHTDCSEMSDKYLKALHVKFENDKELAGVAAFIYVWNNTNGYRWLAKIISLPIINQLSKIAYALIARLLFWRFKIFN